jgi:large subunit ribosomal protein L25
MQIATLQAEIRQAGGTRAAQRLRRTGKLPGVIYGHNEEPETVAVDAHDLSVLLEHGAHVLELDVGGSKKQVLIKDVQLDHLGSSPVHVDFARIDMDERVHVSVPIEFRGEPIGTHEGGLLEHSLVDLEIECRVLEIPESIRVNVSDLGVGQSLHVNQIEMPEGMKAVTPGDAIVCAVRMKAAAIAEEAEVVEEEEAGAEEPEIIGRKEKEEQEEESGS